MVFEDRKLKLSAFIWNGISWKLTKFQLIQLIQTIVIFIFSICFLIELKFCQDFFFQTDAERFSFLSWKTKEVFFLKLLLFRPFSKSKQKSFSHSFMIKYCKIAVCYIHRDPRGKSKWGRIHSPSKCLAWVKKCRRHVWLDQNFDPTFLTN